MSSNYVLPLVLPLLLLVVFPTPCVSDARATLAALVCTNRTATPIDRTPFIANFIANLDNLSPQVASRRFARAINGTGNSTVYGFGDCMSDLSQTDCNQCFAQAKTQILRCLPYQRAVRGGRSYFDGCIIRYDDYDFFGEALSPGDKTICGNITFNGTTATGTGATPAAYTANALDLVRNLSVQAPKNDGFFAASLNRANTTVFALAQCWEFVNMTSCKICLDNAVSAVASCLPKDEGRVLNAGCYMRYSSHRFYNNSGNTNSGGGRGNLGIILAAVFSSVLAAIMIIAAGVFFTKRKITKRRQEKKQLGPLAATIKKSELNFRYETLERATNYFNISNKLGQGGSGSVYKGILPGGKIVAVKRLVFTTRQWADQFFNEVNLISDVHHKNLVKLLGCSITGPESLLVYEYIPNQSLQDHLFSKDRNTRLSWEVRYNIIIGTAEGLVYLHEESRLRIIHRDIKLSNVLLDENFNAKIADFGLARLFPEDKTHISTGIAGTLGYMAPEYVVRGKLTEKADVYSYGVLVIEVVSGRRNNSFTQESVAILQMVWNCYVSHKLFEAVDPRLDGSFEKDQASRVLQIGLLCTQASAELRPSMSMVVEMLTGNHDIPQPTQPPFLNSSSAMGSFLSPGSRYESDTKSSGNSMTESLIEAR